MSDKITLEAGNLAVLTCNKTPKGSYWHQVGAAKAKRDGRGIWVYFNSLPLDGRLLISPTRNPNDRFVPGHDPEVDPLDFLDLVIAEATEVIGVLAPDVDPADFRARLEARLYNPETGDDQQ